MNGIYLYFVNKHLSSWALLRLNQSVPNLVKMYMTIRSWMSFIMELIRPELFELPALELENLPYLTLYLNLKINNSWTELLNFQTSFNCY